MNSMCAINSIECFILAFTSILFEVQRKCTMTNPSHNFKPQEEENLIELRTTGEHSYILKEENQWFIALLNQKRQQPTNYRA